MTWQIRLIKLLSPRIYRQWETQQRTIEQLEQQLATAEFNLYETQLHFETLTVRFERLKQEKAESTTKLSQLYNEVGRRRARRNNKQGRRRHD